MNVFTKMGVLCACAVASLSLAACGGGGDKPSGGPIGVTQITGPNVVKYNSGASVGDLLTYSIDKVTFDYSYLFVSGVYNGQAGKGKLTSLGGYRYQTTTGQYVLFDPDRLAVVEMNIAGADLLIAGVPSRTTAYNFASLVGVYNWGGYISPTGAAGTYFTDHGTFEILPGGNWRSCAQEDLRQVGTIPDYTGTMLDLGNGQIRLTDTATSSIVGTLMLIETAAGAKYLVCDLAGGVFGHGMLIGTEIPAAPLDNSGGIWDGTYEYITNGGTFASVTVTGSNYTSSLGPSGAFTFNSPWDGWVEDAAGFIYLIGKDGAFFGAPNGELCAGLKQ